MSSFAPAQSYPWHPPRSVIGLTPTPPHVCGVESTIAALSGGRERSPVGVRIADFTMLKLRGKAADPCRYFLGALKLRTRP
jgi:hypothetical protein